MGVYQVVEKESLISSPSCYTIIGASVSIHIITAVRKYGKIEFSHSCSSSETCNWYTACNDAPLIFQSFDHISYIEFHYRSIDILLKCYCYLFQLLNVPKDKFTGPLQKKYKRLVNVSLLLGSSLMKLDDALMLFHDF